MTDHKGWPIQNLWEKYEDITMHFNDLIIRLRMQALAGVAALSTLVGLFAKSDIGGSPYTWEIAGFVFSALALSWVAIWALDFGYYNRLLIGAVAALLELEHLSETQTTISKIRLSTVIEEHAVYGFKKPFTWKQNLRPIWAGWLFYILVFVALLAGASFSFYAYFHPALKPLANAL